VSVARWGLFKAFLVDVPPPGTVHLLVALTKRLRHNRPNAPAQVREIGT
jgi:hypothetical protein